MSTKNKTKVSEEDMNGILAAQGVITMLECGKSIVSNSPEHHALTWAVLRLTNEILIDTTPLSGKDLERANQVAKDYRDGKYHLPDGSVAGKSNV